MFHVTTIEQYYTGEIILGPGNLVSDGVHLIVGLSLFAAIKGTTAFHNPMFDGFNLTFSDAFYYILSFIVFCNFLER